MKAQKECFECLLKQASVWSQCLDQYKAMLEQIPKDCNGASLELCPPGIAIKLYGTLAKEKGVDDLYAEIKKECIQKAYKIVQTIDIDTLSLQDGIRISALGNVIDYGSASHFEIHSFDFKEAMQKLEFAHFDIQEFQSRLARAKNLVLIGDNAGENLFDEILLKILKRKYPDLNLYYFVRGYPIINDITMQDLKLHLECQGIFQLARVVDSGVRSAGFVYQMAAKEAQEIFDLADIVIAKGMGNFECMEEEKNEKVFYLLKIKCQVVAKILKLPFGKMVFKQG